MTAPYREIIAVCLLAFLAFWTWGMRQVRRAERSESVASSLVNSLSMWAGMALLGIASVGPRLAAFLSLPASTARSVAGTACVVVGVAIAIWSRSVLGSNWSGLVRITEGQELVTRGPYRLVRHPIYSGMLLAAGGVALALGDIAGLAGFALIFVSLLRKALVEELLLASEFGEPYAAYMRRTKRLIPFVFWTRAAVSPLSTADRGDARCHRTPT